MKTFGDPTKKIPDIKESDIDNNIVVIVLTHDSGEIFIGIAEKLCNYFAWKGSKYFNNSECHYHGFTFWALFDENPVTLMELITISYNGYTDDGFDATFHVIESWEEMNDLLNECKEKVNPKVT